jgi:hypothetical protein
MSKSSLQHGLTLLDPKFKHVLEFGVCRGGTIRTIRQELDDSFLVFGFDSFQGLPEAWVDKHGKVVVPPEYFSTNGVIPDVHGVKFYAGWFSDTLKDYIKIAQPIALLHIDSDLYSSAKEVLVALNDHIVPGTIIVFDEWFYRHDARYDDHEQKAYNEWISEFDRRCEIVAFVDKTTSGEERKIMRVVA